MYYVLTSQNFGAEEAERIGMITKVVPDNTHRDGALKVASAIARNPRLAVLAGKEAVNAQAETPLVPGLKLERRLFHGLFSLRDHGILSGEGRSFCVGTDVKWVNSPGAQAFVDRLYPRLLSLTKPVISAVQGHCNGGGLEQALGTDIRVCADNAHFGFGEIKLGWIPGGHGTQRLPRAMPLGPALELLYTGGRRMQRKARRPSRRSALRTGRPADAARGVACRAG